LTGFGIALLCNYSVTSREEVTEHLIRGGFADVLGLHCRSSLFNTGQVFQARPERRVLSGVTGFVGLI